MDSCIWSYHSLPFEFPFSLDQRIQHQRDHKWSYCDAAVAYSTECIDNVCGKFSFHIHSGNSTFEFIFWWEKFHFKFLVHLGIFFQFCSILTLREYILKLVKMEMKMKLKNKRIHEFVDS